MGEAGLPSTNAGSSLTDDGGEGVGGFVDGGVGFSTRAGAWTPTNVRSLSATCVAHATACCCLRSDARHHPEVRLAALPAL